MLSRLRLFLYLYAKAAEFSTQEKKRESNFSVMVWLFFKRTLWREFRFAHEKLFPTILRSEERVASMLTKEPAR